MEWVNALRGSIVGLDSAPLIYFVELHPRYLAVVDPFFEAMERGEIQVVTSALTLTEVLIYPYKFGNRSLADQYSRILLHSRNLTTIPVTNEIASEAAQLRALHGFKTPDAIHIASAKAGGAASFLSNDAGLNSIPGINVILLDSLLTHP